MPLNESNYIEKININKQQEAQLIKITNLASNIVDIIVLNKLIEILRLRINILNNLNVKNFAYAKESAIKLQQLLIDANNYLSNVNNVNKKIFEYAIKIINDSHEYCEKAIKSQEQSMKEMLKEMSKISKEEFYQFRLKDLISKFDALFKSISSKQQGTVTEDNYESACKLILQITDAIKQHKRQGINDEIIKSLQECSSLFESIHRRYHQAGYLGSAKMNSELNTILHELTTPSANIPSSEGSFQKLRTQK